MTNGETKKKSSLPIILLVLLILGGLGAGGWFGYSFYARKQQEKKDKIAEEQRKADIAKEVSALLKSARATYDEKRREEALAIVEKALKKDPNHAEARQWQAEMSEAIDLEKLIPVKKLAEIRWAATKSLAPGQGFGDLLKKVEDQYTESERLFGIKDYKNAKTNYQSVAADCERLTALDADRQQARSSRDESDKAREAAEKAKAEEEARQVWTDARDKDKEAIAAFENGEFPKAGETWKISTKLYGDAAVFSAGTRAVRTVETKYGEVLATAKAGLLDSFGGQTWVDTKSLAAKGGRLSGEQKWAEAVVTWTAAVASLQDAIKTAWVEEARDIMRKEYTAAMATVGASLDECLKAAKSDTSKIKVLQGDIVTLEKIKAAASYGLLSDDEHSALDAMLVKLHREKFCFRYPDLVQVDEPRDVPVSDLAAGSVEALAAQKKAVVDMDASIEVKTRKTGMVLRLVPAGTFGMGRGSKENGDKDELPRHQVVMTRPFYMGIFEVTQDQWEKSRVEANPSYFAGEGRGAAPVEGVTYEKAVEFCNWLCDQENMPRGTYRLPTEAEWEYACRAGTDSRFYNGNVRADLDRSGWFDRNSDKKTHPVGEKMPNAYGLYDMHGNVWEWCSDGAHTYTAAAASDPVGPASGFTVSNRGGSWRDEADICRSANRGWARRKNLSSYDLGLRVMRVVPPEPVIE